MPTHEHEALVKLVREDPSLVPRILREFLSTPVAPFERVELVESNLTEAMPAEFRADAIFVFRDAAEQPVEAVILEVQRQQDDEKRWTWPAYLALTRARYRCSTVVLVITVDDATAEWARQEILLDSWQGWRPLVAGPESIPRIEEPEVMRRYPTLGLLSALTHSRSTEDLKVVEAAFGGLPASTLDPKVVGYYLEVIDEAARDLFVIALERAMQQGQSERPNPSPLAKWFRDMGREEGREEGIRGSIVTVLATRGLSLSAAQRERLEQCSDVALLNHWLARSISAATTDEIFA